jgi:hypothetical protein
MAIQLSVVGVFFGATVPTTGTQKVIDVLAAAKKLAAAGGIKNVSNFDYEITRPPNVSAISFCATYTGPFKGRGVGYHYSPGEYFLAENLHTTPAYSVWQYYVLNPDKTPVSRGVKFLDNPDATVPDNGTLIWRLVSILSGPNPRPRVAVPRQA